MKRMHLLAMMVLVLSLAGQETRPIRDTVGFSWDRAQMKRLVAYLEAHTPPARPSRGLVAAISPHDDFLYAGRIYYPLYRTLRTKEVVIFGVTHATVRQEIGDPQNVLILDGYSAWPGLGKTVAISPLRDFLKANLEKEYVLVSNRAHELEHSIEAQIPFLQYFNPEIQITPIMVSPMPWERMEVVSEALASQIGRYLDEHRLEPGKEILFLISADANHYGVDFKNTPFGEDESAHRQGVEQDLRLVRDYLCGALSPAKIEGLTRELWGATYRDYRSSYWCGKYSIPFGLLTIEKIMRRIRGRTLEGRLLRYSDTYSEGVIPLRTPGFGITAPFSLKHWVSFFSAGYYLK